MLYNNLAPNAGLETTATWPTRLEVGHLGWHSWHFCQPEELASSWVWGYGWLMMTLCGWWGPLSVLHLFPSSRSVHTHLHASQFPRAKSERPALWSYNRVLVCIIYGVIPSTKARHMTHPQVNEWKGLQRARTRDSFHTPGPQLQQSAVIAVLSQEDSGELPGREERKLTTV